MNKTKKRYMAGSLAAIMLATSFLSFLNPIETKAYYFGDTYVDDARKAVWDERAATQHAEMSGPGWTGVATDMDVYMTITAATDNLLVTQTGKSAQGKYKDWEYTRTYCIDHSDEMMENMGCDYYYAGVYYDFGNYDLNNLPTFLIEKAKENSPDDWERIAKFNFLMMVYAANWDNYLGKLMTDEYEGVAKDVALQSIINFAELAQFTPENYQDTHDLVREAALVWIGSLFNPDRNGSSQVYQDVELMFDDLFKKIWDTAVLVLDCEQVEGYDGYYYPAEKTLEADGYYHIRMINEGLNQYTSSWSGITTYGDWQYQEYWTDIFSNIGFDFYSPTGEIPDGGTIADIDFSNVTGVLGYHIDNECLKSLRVPCIISGKDESKPESWSFFLMQENLAAKLPEGLHIYIGEGEDTPTNIDVEYEVIRYYHIENWNAFLHRNVFENC